MNDSIENNQSAQEESLPSDLENIDTLSGSHQMTLTRYPVVEGIGENFSINSIEYHLTARVTKETLSRRELSLLLEVLNFQCIEYGVNFNMRICLYELYFRLLGNKTQSREIKESKIRLTLTVSELILKSLKDVNHSLSAKEFVHVDPRLKKILKPYLMSKRTYGSRYKTWRPESFLEIRAVPVDIQFLESKNRSNRYSSYCKGYGESHPSTHSKRTMPSPELDGNGKSPEQVEEEFLFIRCTEPIHVLCEFLVLKYLNEFEDKTK